MFRNIILMGLAVSYASVASASQGEAIAQFLPLILIFAIFYFLIIRPQQKRQKEHQTKITAIDKGDDIITAGGVKGKVKKATEMELDVEIAKGVVVTILRATVMDVSEKK